MPVKIKLDKGNFAQAATSLGYKVTPEFKFIPDRRFRADWLIELDAKKVLVEYEGIASDKSRHTSITGYTKDCEKYNLASKHGYTVLRYTALNFGDVFKDLKELREKK